MARQVTLRQNSNAILAAPMPETLLAKVAPLSAEKDWFGSAVFGGDFDVHIGCSFIVTSGHHNLFDKLETDVEAALLKV